LHFAPSHTDGAEPRIAVAKMADAAIVTVQGAVLKTLFTHEWFISHSLYFVV
jgi:hypothetical protein